MAQITVQIAGGEEISQQANTVGELKQTLSLTNFTAAVNGETQADDYQLRDGDHIDLAQAVKGA